MYAKNLCFKPYEIQQEIIHSLSCEVKQKKNIRNLASRVHKMKVCEQKLDGKHRNVNSTIGLFQVSFHRGITIPNYCGPKVLMHYLIFNCIFSF